MTYLAIGIDDTDSQGAGATFALALALLQHIAKLEGVIPIGHQIVMLNPSIEEKTGGNSASYIEIATDPNLLPIIQEKTINFIADESHSNEWGIAMKTGFLIGTSLREYGQLVRTTKVKKGTAERVANQNDVSKIIKYFCSDLS
jgi:tRNA(Ile2) C34 agmatinyltransferase TiaS